jgi:PAS domain S-box-containing protein
MDSKGMDMLSTIIDAFNYMKDGIAIVTIEGTLLYYNRVWIEIHALDPDVDYTGRLLFDIEMDDIQPVIAEGRDAILKEGVFAKQFGTTRRDGKYHIVHVVANLIDHLDPPLVVIVLREVTDLVGVREELEQYRDHLEELVEQRTAELSEANELLKKEVEERQRAQYECHELECRFEKVVDAMPVMMDAFDENGTIICWNKECERVTGYSSKEIIGNPKAIEMLYPDKEYRENILKELRELSQPLRERAFDLTCKNGTEKMIVWSNISVEVPIKGWYTWAIGIEVTERKRIEEALRRSEEKMRAQYKGIPLPTYTWQKDGNDFVLIEYNDAADSITKGRIRELIGIRAGDFFTHDPRIAEEIRECYEKKISIERERNYTFKMTGLTYYFDIKYAFVAPDLVIIHTSDMTERRAVEKELERYRERLEDLVTERTRELRDVNERLRREIAERFRTEKALEKRNRELAALNEAYRIIVTSENMEEIFDRILKPVMRFSGADVGGLYRLDHEHNEIALVASKGIEDDIIEQVKRVSMDVVSVRHLIDSHTALVAEEDMKGVNGGHYKKIKEYLGVKRTMSFFFKSRGRISYMAMLGRLRDENVPQGVRDFLEIIGNQISLAIDRLELLDALERSKTELKNLTTRLIGRIEEERRQIALSLHDETSQTLAAVKNELELLKKRIPAGDPQSKRSLEEIKSHLLEITEGTRSISYSLHPSMLEDLGLIPALNWYAEKFVRNKKLRVKIGSVGFDTEPPPNIGLTLYRVAQEALANVVRHADANRVDVKLTKGYPDVIMVINDDGKGFSSDDDRKPEMGLGIIGMRERVEGLGGNFHIRSSPGKGTRIRVTLPLEVENDE